MGGVGRRRIVDDELKEEMGIGLETDIEFRVIGVERLCGGGRMCHQVTFLFTGNTFSNCVDNSVFNRAKSTLPGLVT